MARYFASRFPFRSWVKHLFQKSPASSRKRHGRRVPLWLERLEGRITPASVTQVGGVLTISLNTTNEALALTSAGATYNVTTTATFSGAGGANFAGLGTATGTITAAGLTQIVINDTAQGAAANPESITFNNSAGNTYTTAFSIQLAKDTAAATSLTFSGPGTSTFGAVGGLSATVAKGNIVAAAASTLITPSLSLTATAGNVTLGGSASVVSTTILNAGGTVSIGTLSVAAGGTLAVTAGGNITQTAAITMAGTATFDSASGAVTLTQATNAFTGSVGGSVTGANPFSITNNVALDLGDITLDTGALAVKAGGNITEFGAVNGIRLGVGGPYFAGSATFTLTVAGSILLDTAPNNFNGGLVTFAGGGSVANQALRDVSSLAKVAGTSLTGNLNSTITVSNVSSFDGLAVGQTITGAGIPVGTTIAGFNTTLNTLTLSQAATATNPGVALATPSTFAFVAPASGTFLKIIYDDAPIAMPAINIAGAAGTLSLTSGGDITQTGAITAAFGNFTLLRSGTINLTQAAGNTIGLVSLNDPNADATRAIAYTGSAGVTLGSCNLGLGTFTINATNGNITQSDLAFTGTTAVNSTIVTAVTNIGALAVGQSVVRTGAPTSVAAGSIITAINEATNTITLSLPAVATRAGATLAAISTITQKRGAATTSFTGNTTKSSALVANVSSILNLAVGQTVTGAGIPAGTTIGTISSFAGVETNISRFVTNVPSTAGLTIGQTVTGTGIPGGTTITGLSATMVTLSNLAVLSGPVVLNVTPTLAPITGSFTFTGKTLIGLTSITSVSSVAGLTVGQVITGAGIPANATIVGLTANTVTLSAAATATASNVVATVMPTVTLSAAATATATATLTRTAALTFNVAGAAGNTVNLTPQSQGAGFHNDFEAAIVVTGAVTIFGLDNASTLANLLPQGAGNPANFLSLPNTIGTLAITFTNTLALLPNWTLLLPSLTTLTVTAQGIYEQTTGTPFSATTTLGSVTVTNVSKSPGLAVGQTVTGTGIAAGTTITAISGTTNFTGNVLPDNTVVTNVSSLAGLFIGQVVTGLGIPAGATITAITSVGGNKITLSKGATVNSAGLAMSVPPTITLSKPATATATASAVLTPSGGITVSGVSTFNAGNFPIFLNNVSNKFGTTAGGVAVAGTGIILNNSGPNAIVVDQIATSVLNFDNGGGTALADSSNIGNGTFTVNAPGGISQTGLNDFQQAANAGRTVFNTANGATSGPITLNGGNTFTGIVSFQAPTPGFKANTNVSVNPTILTNVSTLVGLAAGQSVTGPGIPVGTTITAITSTFIGDITTGNMKVINVPSIVGLFIGEAVTGQGIRAGAKITAIGATSVTLSAAASATATAVVLSVPPMVTLSKAATATATGVALVATPSGNVSVNAAGTLTLGTSVIGGAFNATGGTTITQYPGATLTVGGLSTINFGTVLFNNLGNLFSPGTNFTGNTTLGSTIIQNVANVSALAVGQTVTGAGAGIPVGTTIAAVGTSTITLSQVATATATAVALNAAGTALSFNPGAGSVGVTVRDSKTTGLILGTSAFGAPDFLTVFASGPIMQTGALTNVSNGTFIAGTSAILLTNPANNFVGPVNLISTGSAPVAVTDTNGIQLGSVRLGTGSFAVNAGNVAGSNITQTAFAVGAVTLIGTAGVPDLAITGGITEAGPSTVAFTGNTTIGSATVFNVSSITGLAAGQTVTGVGIPAGTTIASIAAAINFNGTTVSGVNTITGVASLAGLVIGENISGPGIPAGTTITGLAGTTVTMSQAATAASTPTSLFSVAPTVILSKLATATASAVKLSATAFVFNTPFAGANTTLGATDNQILVPINAFTNNLTITNLNDIDLSNSSLAAGSTFGAIAGGVVTLPTVLASFGAFT
jgi:hypothetical protein